MNRRRFLRNVAGVSASATILGTATWETVGADVKRPEPSWSKLPRWRGFNLLEKFIWNQKDTPYLESDFAWMAEWGFDFVRLPTSYLGWIEAGNWRKFREEPLRQIDQAIAWGKQYGIHVCLNFHRAPGYTVAQPKETKSLWTDAEAQEICALHWGAFAKRHKGIPNAQLSFNLLNEPAGISNAQYAKVAASLVNAIRAEDPNRLIIADGNDYCNKPVPELAPLQVAQSTRGYAPFPLTHYKANWVGTNSWAEPTWPVMRGLVSYLYGSGKKEWQTPLVLNGNFSKEAQMIIRVQEVSDRSTLVVRADGKAVLEKEFICGEGKGEWKTAQYKSDWKIWQNLYDKDYAATIPAGTKEIIIENTKGDWMTFSQIRILPNGNAGEIVLPAGSPEWGAKQQMYTLDQRGRIADGDKVVFDRERLWREHVEPWQKLGATGIGVHVGEWGCYQHTPHKVVLAWMRDCLENWRKAGMGWALWNFRGSFGPLDSGRKDVAYEDFRGHKLDRAMLELLRSY